MIRNLAIIVIVLLSLGNSVSANAQEYVATPVTISSEKVNIQGKVFYSHTVLKGQTLYSISKAYNVPIDELNRHNPSLKDGLKTGSIIIIPISQAAETVAEPVTEAPQDQAKRTVTVATLSEVVTPDEAAPAKDENSTKEKNKKYKKHTVKWYENIYDVTQKYKVPLDALVELNELGENIVLKKRQVLLIPDKEYIKEFNRKKNEGLNNTAKGDLPLTFPVDSTKIEAAAAEDLLAQEDQYSYPQTLERSYKISLVLPFSGDNQMDFYAGALIAFKEFKEQNGGKNYKLQVVNLNEYPSVQNMILSGILDGSELVIGPIFEKELTPIAAWAETNNVPLVSPLDPKATALASTHRYFFQFPPDQNKLTEATYNGVVKDAEKHHDKPFIIYEKWTRHSKLVTSAINSFKNKGIAIDTLGYAILEGRGVDTVMVNRMDTTNVNTVFVVSENEAFVSDVLRNLHLAKGQNTKLEISLFGMPKWKNFEILELSYLHELNTHLCLQYHINHTENQTKGFVNDFRYNFNTDPTQYAFQGYDIMRYFISMLDKYGRGFPEFVHMHNESLLQSNIRFEKADTKSGFTNQGIKNVLYSGNWEIKSWE